MLTTTGTQTFGVYTANGGTTTLDSDSITTQGDNSVGVESAAGGQTTINGGTVTTKGTYSTALYATGAGSSVTANTPEESSGVTITTTGADANGVQADTGGKATLNGGSVTVSGIGSFGLWAGGAGSTIAASDVAVTVKGGVDADTGNFPVGAFAWDGARITFSGASITTSGASSDGAATLGAGSSIALTGVMILTTGNGSAGLAVNGSGSATANGVSITTHGGEDPTDGFTAVGVYNGADGAAYPTGGALALTNTTIVTTGADAYGVVTNSGGQTTVNGGSVSASGLHAIGVLTQGSGTTASLTGTAISTSGVGSNGVVLNGTGSSLTLSGVTITTTGTRDPATGFDSTGVYNGTNGAGTVAGGGVATILNSRISTGGAYADGIVTADGGSTTVTGGSVSTAGSAAYAVVANTGGLVKLNGTTIGTTGDGSGGLGINGAGSEIDATRVAITTKGGVDPVSGLHSYGVYNGPYGDLASGGVAKLIDATILTQGADMFGVNTSTGGATTISGGSVATTGPGAYAIVVGGGGSTAISGTTVTATGNGGGGLSVDGGSTLTAAGVVVTTEGGYDPASGRHAYGLFNGPSGTVTSGGVATITNSTISTLADGMHGVVTGAGGTTTLAGTNVSTAGAGAIGVLACGGGGASISGGSITTSGANAYGVNSDGAGSRISLSSTTITTSGAGATGLLASDRAATGSAGTINATGRLDIQTRSASAAAVALQGDGATIAATRGGTITTAGTAIEFLGGTGQSATFDNFKIGSLSGDLVFADPSVATLAFNNTTANAGTGNLLNATAGSAITLNANASMLAGAIRTDASSTTNVNLTNGTTWNLTGSSTVTNLSLTNSTVVFASPGTGGAFKTLTVNNYVGNGANITMAVALGGSGSAGDQIIVNGGKATGSALLTINNVGGLGAQTSGNGIPIVMATNGGSVAANAFALANTPIAGGYRYTLDQSGEDWYLISSPTATVAGLTNSINNVARAQQSQMITNRVLGSLLLGATQQISCSSCGGGFASIGSFALGGDGRWKLSDGLTLMGGVSYNQWSASGVNVYNAPTVAGALIYDFVNWGKSRPFVEVGAGLTPYEQVNTTRPYANGLTTAYGYASATDREASLFGRAGWVDRLTPIDEAAAYVDLGRSWMETGGYSEQTTAINPFPATVPNGLATLNTARFGSQYTHLFNGNIEANVGAAVA